MFALLRDCLLKYRLCALFRCTESSTLGYNAEEFGVYR